MKQMIVRPNQLCHTRVFETLATYFDSTIVDDSLVLPPHIGTGVIKQVELAKGLQIRSWNISVKKEMNILKGKELSMKGKTFHLSYILTPDRFHVETDKLRNIPFQGSMNMIFDSGDHPCTYKLQPGCSIKAMVISVSSEWLLSEFGSASNSFYYFLQQLIESRSPSLFYDPVPLLQQQLLTDFHTHFTAKSREMLYSKAKALTLLSEYLYSLFLRRPGEVEHASILHHDKMQIVERILREHIHSQLPCIRTIARQVAISESTLKRYFQLIYGTSIYDYYLKLKMEQAQTLLTEKRLPVKEVAYTLGYEKSSSFIRMFRKYYHMSPGIFKEKRWFTGITK